MFFSVLQVDVRNGPVNVEQRVGGIKEHHLNATLGHRDL